MSKHRIKTILIFFLIALSVYFITHWKIERDRVSALTTLKNQMIFTNIANLTSVYHHIEVALDDYSKDFTETDKQLYFKNFGQKIWALNEKGHTLSNLLHDYDRRVLIYEEYIWKLEHVLGKISEGEITEEGQVQQIAAVIRENNQTLTDMIYKEQVGEQLYSSEGIERFIKIIDKMNSDINQVISKSY